MKKSSKIIYRVATALLAFGMLASGIQQIMNTKEMGEMLAHLHYPVYFMTIIGVWKILGVIAILMPRTALLKEWAYAGFFFTMTGALASHLACGDHGIKEIAGPVVQTVFIILSWYFRPADRKLTAGQ
jgi:uncharacterized membrane protein YphA (DoxX/SURF4 family)